MGSLLQLKEFQQIAPALSYTLVLSLAIASQLLFVRIDPRPLNVTETVYFNVIVAAVLICYTRAWRTDPGRIPRDWADAAAVDLDATARDRSRWCRKCEMPKPARAHHCKSCQRCIQKMDHHCPWTANCVSYRVMPHFIRFLFFGAMSLWYLQYFLWLRLYALYEKRSLPSYLGPSVTQLVALFVVTIVNSITLVSISFLFVRTTWCVAVNTTTIEGWEIERHEALVNRARRTGGVLEAPNGTQVPIRMQEFPYDIGIWSNLVQGFGTANILIWLWPFAASLPIDGGLVYEENGFEDEGVIWPPPDPDRLYQVRRAVDISQALTKPMDVESFRARQHEDLRRQQKQPEYGATRRRATYEAKEGYNEDDNDKYELDDAPEEYEMDSRPIMRVAANARDQREAWSNGEGERLADYGVDEDVEFYDDEDVPLGELLRMKRQREGAAAQDG